MANPPGFIPERGQGLTAKQCQEGTEGGKEWLKRQKLHKYWPMFSHWSYTKFMSLSEENINEKIRMIGATGMTSGAQGKLLRCIISLQQRERVLLTIQRATQNKELFIADALIYLHDVVRTPLPTDQQDNICATILITIAQVKLYMKTRLCSKYIQNKMACIQLLTETRPALTATMRILSNEIIQIDMQENRSEKKELFRKRITTADSGFDEVTIEKSTDINSRWAHPSGRQAEAYTPRTQSLLPRFPESLSMSLPPPPGIGNLNTSGSTKPDTHKMESFPKTKPLSDTGNVFSSDYRIRNNQLNNIDGNKTYSAVLKRNITDLQIPANLGAIPKNYQKIFDNKPDKNIYKSHYCKSSYSEVNSIWNKPMINNNCIDARNSPIGYRNQYGVPRPKSEYSTPIINNASQTSYRNSFSHLPCMSYVDANNNSNVNYAVGMQSRYFYDHPFRNPEIQILQKPSKPFVFKNDVKTEITEESDLLYTSSILVREVLEKVLENN